LNTVANPRDERRKEEDESASPPTGWQRAKGFYWDNEFLILVVVAILLARAYPPLGATYLAPEITATWIAVVFIFVMAGLGLKTSEFSKALQQVWFNATVQLYNFGVVSAGTYGVSRALEAASILSKDLADGMVVCACLPMTINMVLVLTKSAGGDEAAAIFNAAFGNLLGVFLSPVLILGYLGVTGDVDLADVFYKLALRVLAPVVVGQLLQHFSRRAVLFVKKYKPYFKQAQQYCLVFIVYTVFCQTFEDGSDSSVGDIFLMSTYFVSDLGDTRCRTLILNPPPLYPLRTVLFQFLLLTAFMVAAWYLLRYAFPNQPALRVMGLFGCTHKTVAMGVPLINAIYEDNAAVGLYTLPLLIWHPMQLVMGTFLAPRLAAFVERENARLGIVDDDDEEQESNGEGDNPAAGNDKAPETSDEDALEAAEEGRTEKDASESPKNTTAGSSESSP
jgi:sodium/bile acid cotransporter 7